MTEQSAGNEGAGAAETKTAAAGAEVKAGDAKADAGKTADAKAGEAESGFKFPDEYLKSGKPDLEKIVSKFSEYEAERSARGLPPESADKYVFEAPKDLKMPDGSPAEIDVESDIFKQFRDLAFKMKLPQESAQELFKLGVEMQFGTLSQAHTAAKAHVEAEIAKLGSKGQDRLDNVTNWFKANWGDEGVSFLERQGDHRDVVILEKLIAKFGGAGVSGASKGAAAAAKPDNDLSSIYPTMAKQ